MAKYVIKIVRDLIDSVELFGQEEHSLFRGQDHDYPLLPKIDRTDPKVNTSKREREMLEELKRRTAQDPVLVGKNDWDCLVYAQHYGMATRLLDWTTNPLIALWFACIDQKVDTSGYVYLLFVDDEILLDKTKNASHNTILIKNNTIFFYEISRSRVPRLVARSFKFKLSEFKNQ